MSNHEQVLSEAKRLSSFPMLDNILGQPTSHEALLNCHDVEGKSVLEACARLIRDARGQVIFSGMGASLFAAFPAASQMEQHGCSVQILESSELLHYRTATLRAGDVGVLISRSGGSVEVLRLAEKMRSAGMIIIGVTNLPRTPLAALADITLHIGSSADQLIAVQTYTGTVLALLLLVEQVITGQSQRMIDLSLAAMPLLTSVIDAAREESETWREWLDKEGPLYLLGRGPALGSVHEGALLMHETAKTPALGMSSGQFRHGPVEVVSNNFRAIIFGSPEATRKTDRMLAGDLARMGALVWWLGPIEHEAPYGKVNNLLSWPAIDPVLAPVFDIVPLQFAAYHLALWRNINPGDFRFASEVTGSEAGFPLLDSRVVPPS